MNPFRSLRNYETFVYTIQQHFPIVKGSNLTVVPRGKRTAVLRGQLLFEFGYRLVIQERLSFDNDVVTIDSYGYEIWRGAEKLAWYDSQPHPDDPALAGSLPHHKHIPPNIRKNRIPAPQLSFSSANLEVLIQEIEEMIS